MTQGHFGDLEEIGIRMELSRYVSFAKSTRDLAPYRLVLRFVKKFIYSQRLGENLMPSRKKKDRTPTDQSEIENRKFTTWLTKNTWYICLLRFKSLSRTPAKEAHTAGTYPGSL